MSTEGYDLRQDRLRIGRRNRPYPTPSPTNSPLASPDTLSPPHSPCELTPTAASPKPSRKRRNSETIESDSRSPKRVRMDSESPGPATGLPSPASSNHNDLPSDTPEQSRHNLEQAATSATLSTSNKRKRRLSDGFQFPSAKRPYIRPQAVSDPLPLSTTEDWEAFIAQLPLELDIPSAIPPPFSVDVPESDVPLEVELFNPSIFSSELSGLLELNPTAMTSPSTLESHVVDFSNPIDWPACNFENIADQLSEPSQPPPDILDLASTFTTDPSTFSASSVASVASFDPNQYVPDEAGLWDRRHIPSRRPAYSTARSFFFRSNGV